MKQNIHPNYHKITVSCVCGNTFETGSVKSDISVDICAACHPFFTNEMRFVDRKGRVDAFLKARQRAEETAQNGGGTGKKKDRDPQKSYKEILEESKSSL